MTGEQVPPGVDPEIPSPARLYDYYFGGKDNFEADREAARQGLQVPEMLPYVRANRAFLVRAVRFLYDQGIRQFLDIGAGLPTSPNVHEVVASGSRVVYVDNDPIVLSHAKALLKSSPEGACAYLDEDLRDPATILAGAAGTLDFGKPIAVMLVAVLHLIGKQDKPGEIVRQLMGACVPGSYLVISHPASDIDTQQSAEVVRQVNTSMAEKMNTRDRAGVARLFDGYELVEPGLVRASQWRPDSEIGAAAPASLWAGVAMKA